MTVFFMASERDASYGVGGDVTEWYDGLRAKYTRQPFRIGGDSYVEGVFPPADEMYLASWNDFNAIGSNNNLMAFADAADNVLVRIRGANPTSSGGATVEYWNGAAWTVINVPAVALTAANVASSWVLRVKKHATQGRVQFYVNGVLAADSGNIALTSFGQLAKGRVGGPGINFCAEVIITDEMPVGWGVYTVVPSADGTDTGGTGAVTDVNESSINTATTLQFLAAGDKRSFAHAPKTFDNFVRAVGVAGYIRRVDDTGPQRIRPYVIVGGVRYYGTTYLLTTGFLNYEYVWSTSPASGTDWTTAELNDSEFQMGWEAVA